jgi:iron complex outermembrane receptor protein
MNLFRSRKFTAALSLVATASFFAVAAHAQAPATSTGASAGATPATEVTTMEKFEVTGSYLPLSGTVQASPVVVIQRESIGQTGATDALRLLKQLTPYFAGNGNTGTEINNGGSGESNVLLRNLPTLVLLNGRRIVSSSISNGEFVNLNTIPTGMIERIEILKDGASTIYGSDAIGGVVNIILRRDYNGFEATGRWGQTGNKDYNTREVSIVGGVAGKGASLTIGAQHFENTALKTTDRPLTTMEPAQFTALGTAAGGIPASMSGSFPGRVNSDILAGSPLAVGASGFKASTTTPGVKTDPNAAPMTLAQLEAAGIYLPIANTPRGISVGSATILNTTLFGNPLIVPTKRDQFIANGNKELFGKSFEVFGDFLFAQTTTGGSGLAPTPIAGLGVSGNNTLTMPANNPYNLFGTILGIGQPAGSPTVRTRTEEMGNRSSSNEANAFRSIVGFRGALNDKTNWEVAFNYSRDSSTQRIFGGVNGANMNAAMIPLISGGAYVYDAKGRPLSSLTNSAGENLPVYNFFALPGFNAPETLDALKTTLYQSGVTWLRGVDVLFRSTALELPAGDLRYAVGGENRTEELTSSVDALFANGLALGYNPADTFSGGRRTNKAAFIETNIPLAAPAQNMPFMHQVDLTAAVRYEKIQPGGTATTPKFGLRWQPVDDSFVVRGTWAKGFIAPTIFDLFGPNTGNSPSYTINEGNGGTGSGGWTGAKVTGQFGNAVELSNPNLESSKSKSWTAGVVYSPKQIKGLSITLDYYNIKQDKVGVIDYTGIYRDLNAKGSGSKYAAGFTFADGTKLTSAAANQVTSTNAGTLSVVKDPNGDQQTRGLDIAVDYTFNNETYGRFNVGASANVLFSWKARATASDPLNEYARAFTDSANGLGAEQGNLPSYIVKPYLNHSWKGISSSVFVTYIPEVNAPGTLFGGASPTNTQRINGLAYKIPSYTTVDVAFSATVPSLGFDALRNTRVTIGANNLFDKDAPYVPGSGNNQSENNTNKTTYDIIGRFMFVELKKSF